MSVASNGGDGGLERRDDQVVHTPQHLDKPEQLPLFLYEGRSGPLPAASELVEYENALPGLADRIVTMAESEQKHRHSMETGIRTSVTRATTRGQWLGAAMVVAVLGFGGYLAHEGATGAGAAVVGIDVAAVASVFVLGRSSGGRRPTKGDEDQDQDEDESTGGPED